VRIDRGTSGGDATCFQNLTAGSTNVTLRATANAGSTFIGWRGGRCSGTGSCSFTPLNADTTVTATFKQTITVTVSGTQTFGGTPSFSFTQNPSTPTVGGALTGCTTDATATSPVGTGYNVLAGTCSGLTTDANHQIVYT